MFVILVRAASFKTCTAWVMGKFCVGVICVKYYVILDRMHSGVLFIDKILYGITK
jgi:hypothetical protein